MISKNWECDFLTWSLYSKWMSLHKMCTHTHFIIIFHFSGFPTLLKFTNRALLFDFRCGDIFWFDKNGICQKSIFFFVPSFLIKFFGLIIFFLSTITSAVLQSLPFLGPFFPSLNCRRPWHVSKSWQLLPLFLSDTDLDHVLWPGTLDLNQVSTGQKLSCNIPIVFRLHRPVQLQLFFCGLGLTQNQHTQEVAKKRPNSAGKGLMIIN